MCVAACVTGAGGGGELKSLRLVTAANAATLPGERAKCKQHSHINYWHRGIRTVFPPDFRVVVVIRDKKKKRRQNILNPIDPRAPARTYIGERAENSRTRSTAAHTACSRAPHGRVAQWRSNGERAEGGGGERLHCAREGAGAGGGEEEGEDSFLSVTRYDTKSGGNRAREGKKNNRREGESEGERKGERG